MNCVESRRGGPIDPPSRPRVTIFSRRLLGLKHAKYKNILDAEERQRTSKVRYCTISWNTFSANVHQYSYSVVLVQLCVI